MNDLPTPEALGKILEVAVHASACAKVLRAYAEGNLIEVPDGDLYVSTYPGDQDIKALLSELLGYVSPYFVEKWDLAAQVEAVVKVERGNDDCPEPNPGNYTRSPMWDVKERGNP